MGFGRKTKTNVTNDVEDIISYHCQLSIKSTSDLIFETKAGNFPYYDFNAAYAFVAGYIIVHMSPKSFSADQNKLNDIAKTLHYNILNGPQEKIDYLNESYNEAAAIINNALSENSDGRLSDNVKYICVSVADFLCLKYTGNHITDREVDEGYASSIIPPINNYVRDIMNYIASTKLK